MAREAWPKEEVIETSREVICLAIHRYDKVGESPFDELWPKNQKMSEWAVRLDVMGYPQVRLLDGYGRPFDGVDSKPSARNADTVQAAMRAAARVGSKKPAPPKYRLGKALKKLVPKRRQEDAVSPDVEVRAAVWGELLSKKKKPKPKQLLSIFEWEQDPLTRLAVLWALREGKLDEKDEDALRLLELAVVGGNDYVRAEAIAATADLGGKGAAAILTEVIELVLDRESGWSNPNNMLCAATSAAIEVAEPGMLEILERVLAETGTNNSAHGYAYRAIDAIGKKDRRLKKKVEEILEKYED